MLLLSSPHERAAGRRVQYLAVIDMTGLDGPLVVSGVLAVLLLFRWPRSRRALVRLAIRVGDWANTHWIRAEEVDPVADELWQVERRRRLCADLRRVEHLLATDTWMSATRQRGNRIAYNRLVDDLRHMPVVLPSITQTFGTWDESALAPPSRWLPRAGYSPQPPTVEILEIGWGRRRH
jgi:hypothetical protein